MSLYEEEKSMVRNGNKGIRRTQKGSIGMKKLIAQLLVIAMALTMLCATAEDSNVEVMPDKAKQETVELWIDGDEAAIDGVMEFGLLDEDEIVIDEPSLDGLEDSLIVDEMQVLDAATQDASAAQISNYSNPADFEIDDNGVLVKYKGYGGDVVIPDRVISIGEKAFYDCNSVVSVTIPDSVTNIGKYAFGNCLDLTKVTIGNSVTDIGDGAFSNCGNLTRLTIPDNVTSIGKDAFKACDNLTSVTIPGSATGIVDAFKGCGNLYRNLNRDGESGGTAVTVFKRYRDGLRARGGPA